MKMTEREATIFDLIRTCDKNSITLDEICEKFFKDYDRPIHHRSSIRHSVERLQMILDGRSNATGVRIERTNGIGRGQKMNYMIFKDQVGI